MKRILILLALALGSSLGHLSARPEGVLARARTVIPQPSSLSLEDGFYLLPKGFSRKGDISEMVQNIDYAPTFLELAGMKVPADIQGVSLVPLLEGKHPKKWRKSLYYHFYEYPAEHAVKRHYGVSNGRYKLIHFYNDIDEWELYDLQADPTQHTDLARQKPALLRRLKKKFLRQVSGYYNPDREQETLK